MSTHTCAYTERNTDREERGRQDKETQREGRGRMGEAGQKETDTSILRNWKLATYR